MAGAPQRGSTHDLGARIQGLGSEIAAERARKKRVIQSLTPEALLALTIIAEELLADALRPGADGGSPQLGPGQAPDPRSAPE